MEVEQRIKTVSMAITIGLMFSLVLPGSILAAERSLVAKGVYEYQGRFKEANYDVYRDQAISDAVKSIWTEYVGSMPASKQMAYEQVSSQFTNDLSKYVYDPVVIEEEHDKKTKRVEVVVRATISESAVNAALMMNSAVVQSSGDGGIFSFIFMAREVASVKAYQDKIVKISASESASEAHEDAAVVGASSAVSEGQSSFEKTTSGGSAERKADSVIYTVASAQDIDSAMGQVLSTAGYEIVSYGDVVSECGGAEPDAVRAEFSQSDNMSREMRKRSIDAARECGVSYFATGTIDIGLRDLDPVTGNKRVYVSVRGQVWDITPRLPRKVASVGPVQYSGLGPDQSVAQRNALTLAAQEAAQELVNQMNAKGLY